MAGFEKLDVWNRAVDLSASVYRCLTDHKDFGFKDQISRSALSITSNIAEGMERSSLRERVKFLDYAKASCGEFRTQAMIGVKAGLLKERVSSPWIDESRQISSMIYGLIRSQKGKTAPL